MHNVTTEVKGKKLIITIDLDQDGQPSKSSDKNMVVAGTGGFTPVPNTNCRLSVNVIRGKGLAKP